jgi:BirA family biotin operon repressor/biotin-[acetyl-CoA-carboxylase] ligase
VAVSLAESIESLWGVRVDLKWPNDIYIHGKKCGGILLQHQSPYMFIGIGLNVNPVPESPWGSVLATSIDWKTPHYHEIPARLVSAYHLAHPRPLAQLQQAWNDRCAHLGRIVTITDGEEKTSGLFEGLGQHGEAIVNGKHVFNGSLRWD